MHRRARTGVAGKRSWRPRHAASTFVIADHTGFARRPRVACLTRLPDARIDFAVHEHGIEPRAAFIAWQRLGIHHSFSRYLFASAHELLAPGLLPCRTGSLRANTDFREHKPGSLDVASHHRH